MSNPQVIPNSAWITTTVDVDGVSYNLPFQFYLYGYTADTYDIETASTEWAAYKEWLAGLTLLGIQLQVAAVANPGTLPVQGQLAGMAVVSGLEQIDAALINWGYVNAPTP